MPEPLNFLDFLKGISGTPGGWMSPNGNDPVTKTPLDLNPQLPDWLTSLLHLGATDQSPSPQTSIGPSIQDTGGYNAPGATDQAPPFTPGIGPTDQLSPIPGLNLGGMGVSSPGLRPPLINSLGKLLAYFSGTAGGDSGGWEDFLNEQNPNRSGPDWHDPWKYTDMESPATQFEPTFRGSHQGSWPIDDVGTYISKLLGDNYPKDVPQYLGGPSTIPYGVFVDYGANENGRDTSGQLEPPLGSYPDNWLRHN